MIPLTIRRARLQRTRASHSDFANALREVLGLDPLPGTHAVKRARWNEVDGQREMRKSA